MIVIHGWFTVYIWKMYTSEKWYYFRAFFSSFHLQVWFSQFSGGWKDKKCPKMTKKSVWHALKFQETCIYFMWSSFMVHMCKRIISPGIFFNFWKFSFSGSLGGEGVKGKKWPKMTKELCLPHTISQELYIISLWFLVHMFKMMISPAIFFFFKIF